MAGEQENLDWNGECILSPLGSLNHMMVGTWKAGLRRNLELSRLNEKECSDCFCPPRLGDYSGSMCDMFLMS